MKYRIFFLTVFLSCLFFAERALAEETLVWEDCVAEAWKNHPELVSALSKVDQAKASKEITRSAYLPDISSGASETTTANEDSSGAAKRREAYTYEITGQQLLFDGFKTSYDLSAGEQDIITQKYNYDVVSSDVRLGLRTAFVDLLRAQEMTGVTERIAKRREQNYELVKLRYEGGREHKGSLMTSDADFARARFDVEQARRDVYYSQRQLTKELGRSKMMPIAAKGDLEVTSPERKMPDLDLLAESTPFLRQLIAEKEAAKYGLMSAKAQFFPQVYASGSAGRTDNDWPPERNQLSFGFNVTLPIFEGGSRLANVRKAKAALLQSQADERNGRDGVILTLADSWTKLQNAIDNVAIQLKYLEATRERARIAEEEYSIGLLSFDNWIIIEDNLVAAEKDYLNAKAEALIAEAVWVQAKGGTLEHD